MQKEKAKGRNKRIINYIIVVADVVVVDSVL